MNEEERLKFPLSSLRLKRQINKLLEDIQIKRFKTFSIKDEEKSKEFKEWRNKQERGAIMEPATFEEIKKKAMEEGYTEEQAKKIAGNAYWNTAEKKYKEAKKDENERVLECIAEEYGLIRKEQPELPENIVETLAKEHCGQKAAVQISTSANGLPEEGSGIGLGTHIVDEPSDECVQRKIKIFASENPDWEQKHIVAAAYGYCKEHANDFKNHETLNISTENILKTYPVIKDQISDFSFQDYVSTLGFFATQEDTSICYKMDKIEETNTEYIVPVVLARAMVQPYPSHGIDMAKLPEDLAKITMVDYETGEVIDRLPTFEFHPEEEKRENENGYAIDIHYQPEKERVVGELHALKAKLGDNLLGYFKRREPFHVSIGFMYIMGEGGIFQGAKDNKWNGTKYHASQKNIIMTHLALLPPNKAQGRCPLPYCGVGLAINDSIPLDSFEIKNIYIPTKLNSNIDKTENIDAILKEITQLKTLLRKHFIMIAQAISR